MTPAQLREARECLLGVSLLVGLRAVGSDRWQADPYADDRIVALTRSTVTLDRVRPDGTMAGRRVVFSLADGRSKPRNGVEYSLHPFHAGLLRGLLAVG